MNTMENSTILKETENMSYEDRMLYAFVNKPEKFYWYKKAFSKYNINGIKTFAWNWSWYSFFFPIFYLFYRKAYLFSALIFFVYSIASGIGEIFSLIVYIILGGTLPYIVYNRYIEKKKEIEENIKDENLRIETMARIGGTNNIVLYFSVVIIFFLLMTIYYVAMSINNNISL